MVQFWAKVKSNTFDVKQRWLLFGKLLEHFGLLFNLVSGHSEARKSSFLKSGDQALGPMHGSAVVGTDVLIVGILLILLIQFCHLVLDRFCSMLGILAFTNYLLGLV